MAAFTPPALIEGKREWAGVAALFSLLFLLHVGWYYYRYVTLMRKPFIVVEATAVDTYVKQKGTYRYRVVKADTDNGWRIYTTLPLRYDIKKHRIKLRLLIQDSHITFVDILRRFYVKSRLIRDEGEVRSGKTYVVRHVASQHSRDETAALYNALFFAEPLPKALRERLAALGVSHLVALSGFHIGIVAALLYTLLRPMYRMYQRRFAPYRSEWVDLGAIVSVLSGMLLWFVGAPDSLVRAYVMSVVLWLATVIGVKVVDFTLLAVTVAVLLAFYPPFVLSVGFWLSVAGVGYIFLLLQYGGAWIKRHPYLGWSVIPVGVFVLMAPFVHYFFDTASLWQLFSPFVSVVFTLFYPLSMLLHLVGYGDAFDTALSTMLHYPIKTFTLHTPLWAFIAYTVLSFAAIKSRTAFVVLLTTATAFLFYGYA